MKLPYVLIVFAVIHILLCIIIYICIRNRILKFSEQLMPIICLVPIAGIICAVFAEYFSRSEKTGTREITLEEMHLDDSDLRIKKISPDEDEGMVIPLEEAMSINDSATRRQLMLDILRKSPEQYTALLQKACTDEDIEVSHYASTAVMEIQREYDYNLQKSERLYRQDENNPIYRNKYINHLKSYIESGLIDDNILFLYRHRFSEVLGAKIKDEPENMDVILCAADNYLALKNYTSAEELSKTAVKKWPNREEALLSLLKVYEQMNNGEGIKKIISHIKNSNVYLSNHGKSVLAFWDKSAQTEEL